MLGGPTIGLNKDDIPSSLLKDKINGKFFGEEMPKSSTPQMNDILLMHQRKTNDMKSMNNIFTQSNASKEVNKQVGNITGSCSIEIQNEAKLLTDKPVDDTELSRLNNISSLSSNDRNPKIPENETDNTNINLSSIVDTLMRK